MTISQTPCNLCHDTRIPQLNPTWTAKTRAIPSWHRDCFAAQEPGCARCVRRVTQPPFIAVPLAVRTRPHNTMIANAQARVLQPVPASVRRCKTHASLPAQTSPSGQLFHMPWFYSI